MTLTGRELAIVLAALREIQDVHGLEWKYPDHFGDEPRQVTTNEVEDLIGKINQDQGNRILIVMEGGLIQDIIGIPEETEIVVRDFDVEGCDVDNYLERGILKRSSSGDLCTEVVWSHDPDNQGFDEFANATKEDVE